MKMKEKKSLDELAKETEIETEKKGFSLKKLRKIIKRLFFRIIYFFNKKSKLIPEKWKKKFDHEKKKKEHTISINFFDRLLYKITGTEDLMFPDGYPA